MGGTRRRLAAEAGTAAGNRAATHHRIKRKIKKINKSIKIDKMEKN
jgi:hypothetical protein